MAISFEKIFSNHSAALHLRDKRSEILASNLANADTPGYKARDLEFGSVLKGVKGGSLDIKATHPKHLASQQSMSGSNLLYTIPSQPSLDGNTVESHVEQAKFAENALRYQASLGFINGSIAGVKMALRGD